MRQHGFKVSKEVMELAAAAYEYTCEVTNPAQDLRMRVQRREQLVEAERKLSVEDRMMLHRRGQGL